MKRLLYILFFLLLPISALAQGSGGEIRRPVGTTNTNIASQQSKPVNNTSPNKVYGHEFVDLGLNVKWATCNIGASSPQDSGYYFAWGETKPKSDYSWKTYFDLVDGSANSHLSDPNYSLNKDDFVKYNRFTNLKFGLNYDAAFVLWGGTWRTPSHEDFNELWTLTHEWTSINGVYGVKFVSNNGNSIFLPAVGGKKFKETMDAQETGLYWINELHDDDYDVSSLAKIWLMDKESGGWSTASRCFGFPIRPVTE